MDQAGNGGSVGKPHAAEAGSAMPAEFGALYHAGYEAGYATGREAGYQQGYAEGCREARSSGSGRPDPVSGTGAGASAGGNRRRGLLGLPCEHCGTFLYSDEVQCPHCKKVAPCSR